MDKKGEPVRHNGQENNNREAGSHSSGPDFGVEGLEGLEDRNRETIAPEEGDNIDKQGRNDERNGVTEAGAKPGKNVLKEDDLETGLRAGGQTAGATAAERVRILANEAPKSADQARAMLESLINPAEEQEK